MKTDINVVRAYSTLVVAGDWLQPIILLVFRLFWGWEFFLTGKGKLLDHESVTQFFTSLNIPMPEINAWFIGGLECIGGLLLLIGLCTRPIGLLLTISMTIAYLAVPNDRAKVLNIFHDPDKFLSADPFFFWLTSVLMLAFGPGLFSVDTILKRTIFKEKFSAQPASRTQHPM